MKLTLCALLVLFGSVVAYAEDIYRIEIGGDHKYYSDSDLRRRVWELERAVSQLQRKVFELQDKQDKSEESKGNESWLCTVSAMGSKYTGTGASEVVAKHKAMENCRAKAKDSFFCSNPVCEH